MPPLVVKWSKCSVSIASARTTIDHKAYDAVISNMGFVILGDFTVDRQATGWRSARCDIFAPCDTSCGLARIGHARGQVEDSIIHYSFARRPT
jgi:hypothetical protein